MDIARPAIFYLNTEKDAHPFGASIDWLFLTVVSQYSYCRLTITSVQQETIWTARNYCKPIFSIIQDTFKYNII